MSNLVCHDFQEMVWKLSISECRLLLDALQRRLAADAHFYLNFPPDLVLGFLRPV